MRDLGWVSVNRVTADAGSRKRPANDRLHANAEDAKRKFNRAENVREIPPGHPDFEIARPPPRPRPTTSRLNAQFAAATAEQPRPQPGK